MLEVDCLGEPLEPYESLSDVDQRRRPEPGGAAGVAGLLAAQADQRLAMPELVDRLESEALELGGEEALVGADPLPAGVDAQARVGDEDLVQAVEDQLVTFDATEVFLVTRPGSRPDTAIDDLRERLQPPFRHVELC